MSRFSLRRPSAPSDSSHQASDTPCPGDLTVTSRSSDIIVGELDTCPSLSDASQDTGDSIPAAISVTSEIALMSSSSPHALAMNPQLGSPVGTAGMAVPSFSRSGETVPGDYVVTMPTCDDVPRTLYTSDSILPSQNRSGQRAAITENPSVPAPHPYGSQQGSLHGDTWRARMESLMSRTVNVRQPRLQETSNQSMNSPSPSSTRSVSLGACVRGRCEGFVCIGGPPVSPVPSYKAQCHKNSSLISLKNLNSPQSPYRCHVRSQSDQPSPHALEPHESQTVVLPSVDLSVSSDPVRWNSSPRFSTTSHVAGGVMRANRSSPSPVHCSTPSQASEDNVSLPTEHALGDNARSKCVASCVQWIHDPVPPWPTAKAPQPRTHSAVQREVGFEAQQLPATLPQRQSVEPSVQWYSDCMGSIRNVRRHGEGTVTTKATYSPTLNSQERSCQSQVNNGAVCLHSIPSRSNINSPQFKVKFVKGETQCVTPHGAPPAPKLNSIKIPEDTNTKPPGSSVPF